MNTFAESQLDVIVGIDTHKDVHVAACLSPLGEMLGTLTFSASRAGFKKLQNWTSSLGVPRVFGIEGTGTYGAGLSRHLRNAGYQVVEVERPNRQRRRRLGKSDNIDAEWAARSVLAADATATPKSQDGDIEMIRTLRVARRSAQKARTQAINQIKQLIVAAPIELREQLDRLSTADLLRACSRFRPGPATSTTAAAKFTLRILARRVEALDDEVKSLDNELNRLVERSAPDLLELKGVGTDVAGALLVTAGDNPERLRSEASFASLCGVSPVEASSGKKTRHRLNRAGDRSANNALWRIVFVRMAHDERTKTYIARRLSEGLTKKEACRCLKRYVAREIYGLIVANQAVMKAAA